MDYGIHFWSVGLDVLSEEGGIIESCAFNGLLWAGCGRQLDKYVVCSSFISLAFKTEASSEYDGERIERSCELPLNCFLYLELLSTKNNILKVSRI